MKKGLIFLLWVMILFSSTNVNSEELKERSKIYYEVNDKIVFDCTVPEIPKTYILQDKRTLNALEEEALKFIDLYSKEDPKLLLLKENRKGYKDIISYNSKYNSLIIAPFGIQFTDEKYLGYHLGFSDSNKSIEKSAKLLNEIFEKNTNNDFAITLYKNKVTYTQYYKGVKVGIGKKIDGFTATFYREKIIRFLANLHSFEEIKEIPKEELISPLDALQCSKKAIESLFLCSNYQVTFDRVNLIYFDDDFDQIYQPVWEFSTLDRKPGYETERYVICINALTGKFITIYA